jgi:hypothetical protein
VDGDADVAAAAALIGEPARAALLLALMEEETLPARELAARAGVAPSTASGTGPARRGRAPQWRAQRPPPPLPPRRPGSRVALEALSAIAPPRPVRTLREATVSEAIRQARTCYDHLAGRLGVQLSDALERTRIVASHGEGYALGPAATPRLGALGIDVERLSLGRRPLLRGCLDWSQRRPHLAGALGAALAHRLFELG